MGKQQSTPMNHQNGPRFNAAIVLLYHIRITWKTCVYFILFLYRNYFTSNCKMNATHTCMHMIYLCQSADTVLSILRTKHIPTVKKNLCINITLNTLCIRKMKIDEESIENQSNRFSFMLLADSEKLLACCFSSCNRLSPFFTPSNSRSSWLLMCCKISIQRPSDFWKQL